MSARPVAGSVPAASASPMPASGTTATHATAPAMPSGSLELPVERVLVTHGEPVLSGGAHALRAALAAEPWNLLRPREAAAG